jgi:sulfoxide reductase heme-binding subunit YedZ
VRKLLSSKWLKVLVFLLCLVPVGILGWRAVHGDLTANPIEFITHATGDWTLRFLLITLAITPLRMLLGLPELVRFRRMLGLFAFFYACLHFSTWLVLDKFFDMSRNLEGRAEAPFHHRGFRRVPAASSRWRSPPPRAGSAAWAANAGRPSIASSISAPPSA